MNWQEFIASLVSSLAWPLAVLGIVWILRHQLVALLERVTKFKHGDTELTFGEHVAKTEEAVSEAAAAALEPPLRTDNRSVQERLSELAEQAGLAGPLAPDERELFELAEQAPAAAVLQSWKDVRQALSEVSIDGPLPDPLGRAVEELRETRNVAAHRPVDISSGSASAYVDMAFTTTKLLDLLRKRDPQGD